MTQRALSLLALPYPSLVLDIGCGSGLSGESLTASGHTWIGMDISASMLAVALDRQTSGDLFLADIGQGVPFRPGTFDAAISISAIQWLCNADSSDVSATGRLSRFFEGLYAALKRGGKAVLQFYPKNEVQRRMITSAAIRAGFGAGLLEDDPGTKNVKVYLVLTAGAGSEGGGTGDVTNVVRGLEGVDVIDERRKGRGGVRGGDGEGRKGSKGWILRKKEQGRNRGKVIKADSKYTGRKRRPAF
ncbi:unnamed protein product [Tuber aestivum]|uniref:Methyltransferase type 11 domain-containing protein n=1 Tax=Tuber aestivum TaxID=59557 RepID=A0A292Q082_9PEZI|nr:unnamed protein product [Tuber aestivum]